MTQEEQDCSPPVIEVIDLEFSYGKLPVLDGLSLTVGKGTTFGLLGANGCGKTTLIRLLLGLLKPAGGSLRVLGRHPTPRLASQVGYMPQSQALYQELSVLENVSFFARMYGMADRSARREAVESTIRLVGLWDRRNDPVQHLSGGMRQRVSLSIALAHQPAVLFLDEPTVGLDPELRVMFWDHFRTLTDGGTTLVLSSHTMDDAAHSDRLAFLQDGAVIADGSPSELRRATGDEGASLEDAFLFFLRQRK